MRGTTPGYTPADLLLEKKTQLVQEALSVESRACWGVESMATHNGLLWALVATKERD